LSYLTFEKVGFAATSLKSEIVRISAVLEFFDRELAEYWRLRNAGPDERGEYELARWPFNLTHDRGRKLVLELETLAKELMKQAQAIGELSVWLERLAPTLTGKILPPPPTTTQPKRPNAPYARFCWVGCGAPLDDCKCEGGPKTWPDQAKDYQPPEDEPDDADRAFAQEFRDAAKRY
jgi:hypothetical protein